MYCTVPYLVLVDKVRSRDCGANEQQGIGRDEGGFDELEGEETQGYDAGELERGGGGWEKGRRERREEGGGGEAWGEEEAREEGGRAEVQ